MLKTDLNRCYSSITNIKQYLQRQASDPYIKLRKQLGYRSRAAIKLSQINDKFKILRPKMNILDLGASPGGWSQIATEKVFPGHVFAVDLLEMEEIPNVTFIKGNMQHSDIQLQLRKEMECRGIKGIDVVLSDMAHELHGNPSIDIAKMNTLVLNAAKLATDLGLTKGGTFVCKFFQGEGDIELRNTLKEQFSNVKYEKPDSSRRGSREGYFICLGKL